MSIPFCRAKDKFVCQRTMQNLPQQLARAFGMNCIGANTSARTNDTRN